MLHHVIENSEVWFSNNGGQSSLNYAYELY